MVEIFVYFVLKSITKIKAYEHFNVFYVTMLSCTNIEILNW